MCMSDSFAVLLIPHLCLLSRFLLSYSYGLQSRSGYCIIAYRRTGTYFCMIHTLMTQCKERSQREGLMLDSAEVLYKWFTEQV